MRLHSLSITAFGPFAETVEVDFDRLGEAGLFLLSGATGAGKTSVLDAVCFALYGEVPGDRNAAKRLRCDQAAAATAPGVELEVTLAGRRFRLRRSPAWDRPKKRGHGTTPQQASVVIRERVAEDWVTRATRLDEAGHLVTTLLGMNLTQFCQVALLPQGRFQSFLRARSEERHQLLQQLFRTQRFSDMETWLAEHRRTLRRTAAAAQESVVALCNRFSEVADAPAPEASTQTMQWAAQVGTWSLETLETATVRHQQTVEAHGLGGLAVAEAELVKEQVDALARLQREYAEALAQQIHLAEVADEHARERLALERAAAAQSLASLIRVCEDSDKQRELATVEFEHAVLTTGGEVGEGGFAEAVEAITIAHELAVDESARLRTLLPRAEELRQHRTTKESWQREIEVLDSLVASLQRDQADAQSTVADQTARLAESLAARVRIVELRQRREILAGRLAAHRESADLLVRVAANEREVLAHRAAALAGKEEWLSIREERLSGMAAEIASRLVVGSSCPVCGSAEHPQPAQSALNAPDAAAEQAARARHADAEAELHAFEDQQHHLAARLSVVRDLVGDKSVREVTRERTSVDSELADLMALTSAEELQDRLTQANSALVALAGQLTSARSRRDSLAGGLAQLGPALTAIQDELAAALSTYAVHTVEEALAVAEPHLDDLSRAITAGRTWESAYAAHQRDTHALDSAAARAGFVEVADAIAALLPDDDLRALETNVRAHEASLEATRKVLDSPDHRHAADQPEADTGGAATTLAEARAALTDLEIALAGAASRRQRLADLVADLSVALAAWTPVLEELRLATTVAALADGTSGDNTLQMRFSAYVLAYRLGQVVAAANERLVKMSDQRYSLEHTERRGAGERRGGLSLLVRDDWSGESRDPATLSGGETFVVSLALALGLADVIGHEIGGADLDTLFVDEGFGALDADTLDDVMDTLDSLREGGRVVGVVSHVTEMRHRIPTRLHVTKRRSGSTLELIHGR